MEQIKADQSIHEKQQLLSCAMKMLENIELQIYVTYDYHQLKALYEHKEVILKMIENNRV